MTDEQGPGGPKRHYPPLYEKLVPIALVAIGMLVLILLAIVVVVVMGVSGAC